MNTAVTMPIEQRKFRFDSVHDAIRFSFSDGSREVQALVSQECMEADFSVRSNDIVDWLAACVQFTHEIESAALELWQEGAPEPVVVKSGNVRLTP